jgi:hypothetical protein
MLPGEAVDRLAAAETTASQAAALLISPLGSSLEQAVALLEKATEDLSALPEALAASAGSRVARESAKRLRLEVRRAGGLLESAQRFFNGWSCQLGSMTGGYTAGGEPAAIRRPGHLSVSG